MFMLVQKVKQREYKIYDFRNEALLCQDSASYFTKNDVYFSHAQSYQKMYPHFKSSHFFYDLKYSAEALSI